VLLSPLPGVDRDQLLSDLQEIARDAANLRASRDLYRDYVQWANDAGQKLGHVLRTEDVDRLVFTRRYWLLQAMAAGGTSGSKDAPERGAFSQLRIRVSISKIGVSRRRQMAVGGTKWHTWAVTGNCRRLWTTRGD
jgi:hypothetical protein